MNRAFGRGAHRALPAAAGGLPRFTFFMICGKKVQRMNRDKLKTWILAIFLMLCMCLPMAGCGAFQTQMAKTTTKMSKLESMHAEVLISDKERLTIGNQKIRLNTIISGGVDIETDPFTARTDLKLKALGVERDIKLILQHNYDTLNIYIQEPDSELERLGLTMHSAKRLKVVQALKLLIKCGDYFADPVDDTVGGVPARRYDGVFPDEYVNEALVLLELRDAPEAAEATIKPAAERAAEKALEEELKENEAYRAILEAAEAAKAAEGLPASLWLDERDMILQVDVDLTRFMQGMEDGLLEDILSTYDLDGLVLDSEVESIVARITFSQFDEVEKIAIPD